MSPVRFWVQPPFLYLRQSNRLAFFVFSPEIYPQKPPHAVSGKLSSTPKPCKVAHLLRFFGNPLCHPRNLTQCVTYYKSTRVYYNIPASFSQAAIHTSRDANCQFANYLMNNILKKKINCDILHRRILKENVIKIRKSQ